MSITPRTRLRRVAADLQRATAPARGWQTCTRDSTWRGGAQSSTDIKGVDEITVGGLPTERPTLRGGSAGCRKTCGGDGRHACAPGGSPWAAVRRAWERRTPWVQAMLPAYGSVRPHGDAEATRNEDGMVGDDRATRCVAARVTSPPLTSGATLY